MVMFPGRRCAIDAGKNVARFGRLDFAFNNAGIEGQNAPLHECTEENWDKTIAVNLKGVWLCMKSAIPGLSYSS